MRNKGKRAMLALILLGALFLLSGCVRGGGKHRRRGAGTAGPRERAAADFVCDISVDRNAAEAEFNRRRSMVERRRFVHNHE